MYRQRLLYITSSLPYCNDCDLCTCMPVAPVTKALFFTVILQPQSKCCQCSPDFVSGQATSLLATKQCNVCSWLLRRSPRNTPAGGVADLDLWFAASNSKDHGKSLVHLELANVVQAMHKSRIPFRRRFNYAGKSLSLRTTRHLHNKQGTNIFLTYVARLALHHACAQMWRNSPTFSLMKCISAQVAGESANSMETTANP